MSLVRYKVLRSDVENGESLLPEKAISVSVLPMPDVETGRPMIAFLMTYADWAEEFPDEAKKREESKEEESKEGAQDA